MVQKGQISSVEEDEGVLIVALEMLQIRELGVQDAVWMSLIFGEPRSLEFGDVGGF